MRKLWEKNLRKDGKMSLKRLFESFKMYKDLQKFVQEKKLKKHYTTSQTYKDRRLF